MLNLFNSYINDYNNNLIKTTSTLKGKKEVSQYVYDDYGRLKEAINNNGKTTYKYNEFNQLEEVNESGSITKYEYDIYGNVIKLTYPDNTSVIYEYDDENNIINLTDKLGISTFEYDDNSRLLNQETPSTKSSYSYDSNGNKLTTINTDLDDNLVSSYNYEYNSINNVSKEILTDLKGTTSKEYTYNESNEISELKEIDINGLVTTTSYEFDIYGNKSKEIVTDSNNNITTSVYLYNKDNQLTEKLIDSKLIESYKYDDNGNLISKETKEGKYSYTYSPSNKLEDTYINGKLESSYYYNTSGLKSHELLRKEYPYDYEVDDSYYVNYKKFMNEIKDHNPNLITSIKEKVGVQETRPETFFSAIINFFINIFKAIVNFFINIYYFIIGSKPKEDTKQDILIDKQEDDKDIEEEKPSFFKRLISLFHTEDDIQVIFEPSKYTYDYTYDNPLILSESYNTSSYKSNYVYLINRLLEDTKQSKSYLYDGKYSISEVISKDNTLSLRYDIYGNITNTKLTQEDKTFSYNTLEYTPQNRLYYIKARYYDPTISSFITKDTYLGNIYKPTTTNRYAYCSGDPVNNMDLNGHMVVMDSGAGGGGSSSKHITTPISNKPSGGGGKKPSGTPSGAYISGGFDGGSSYVYVPPPPNPREKYQKPSIFDKLIAKASSAINSVKSAITNVNKTVKSVMSTVSNSKVVRKAKSVLTEVTTKVSKATTEFVSNTVTKATNAFNEIKEDAKQVVDNFAKTIDDNLDVIAITGATIGTIAVAAGAIAVTATGIAPVVLSGLALVGKIGFGIGIGAGSLNILTGLSGKNLVGDDLSYTERGERIINGSVETTANVIGYDKARSLSKIAAAGKLLIDEAKNSQLDGGYNVDKWKIRMMKEGQTVWGGEPGQSNFYTTNEVAEAVGTDATKLYQGLQAAPGGPENNYRELFTQWSFNQDTLVGFSQANANPSFGQGGFDQYYVPNFTDVLEKIGSISMTNR